MMVQKFDNDDRRRVVAEFERVTGIQLTRRLRQKYFEGSDGRFYCVLGGTGDWHGIPKEIFEAVKRDPGNHVLVLARKKKDYSYAVYSGPMQPFVEQSRSLSWTRAGAVQFDTEDSGRDLRIKQISSARLRRMFEFQYTQEQEEAERAIMTDIGSLIDADAKQRMMRALAKLADRAAGAGSE